MRDVNRFWSKVDIKDTHECWSWKGRPNNSGYGRINISGTIYLAHRISWLLANGLLPDELVLHRCSNRLCVNPKHLYLGTYSDNALDRERDLRRAVKPHNGPAQKLNSGEVWLLQKLSNASIYYKTICKMFGISKSLYYNLR